MLAKNSNPSTLKLRCNGPLEPRHLLAVVAADGFEDYTAGAELDGLDDSSSGWSGSWDVVDARSAEVTITDYGLSYSNNALSVQGGSQAVQYVATETTTVDLISRQFDTQTADTVFLSFLYQQTANAGNTADFFQVGFGDGNPVISAIDLDGTFAVRSTTNTTVAANTVSSGLDATNGETFFIVLKAEKLNPGDN